MRPYDPLYYDPSGYADYGGYMPDRAYLSRPMRNLSSTRYGGGRYDDYGRGMSPPPRDRYRDSLRYGSPIPSIRTTTQVRSAFSLDNALLGASHFVLLFFFQFFISYAIRYLSSALIKVDLI